MKLRLKFKDNFPLKTLLHEYNCFLSLLLDIDDCSPNPCRNGGTCTDEVNNYTCSCVAGYTGYNCTKGYYAMSKVTKVEVCVRSFG